MILKNIRKIFLLGDLHLGIRNNSVEWSDIQTDFLLGHFLEQVDAEGFDPDQDILLQVGDWNHVRESTNVRIQEVSQRVAELLCKKFKRGVYFFVGNHDCYYKDRTDVHSLKGYDRMFQNFHIFEQPTQLSINSHQILILPWCEKSSDLQEQVKKHKADYLFCHADFTGFSLNSATRLEHGLTQEDVTSYKRVYSGHIHIRQRKDKIVYIGTPYEMDRGDRGNQKGFYVLDASGKDFEEKFVPNEFSPKHLKFDIFELLSLNEAELKKIFHNNFIDVMIESEFSSRFPITRFTEIVKEYGHRRLEFFSYSKEQVKNKSEVELNSNYEYNIFTVLDEKIKSLNYSPDFSKEIVENFKRVYDSLRNNKSYEQ
jgi:hypothetical protein